MLIAITNQSTMVSNADLTTICKAIQIQLDLHVLPAWNWKASTVSFYADATKIPGYAWTIYVVDSESSVPDALGFHQEETEDKIDGYIMSQPILSNGGAVMAFDAANPDQYTISGTLSHEVIEAVGDVYTNTYCDDNKGNSWCRELCDAVEQISCPVVVDGVSISVSDFLFPSYFNPYATLALNKPFNFLATLQSPFS